GAALIKCRFFKFCGRGPERGNRVERGGEFSSPPKKLLQRLILPSRAGSLSEKPGTTTMSGLCDPKNAAVSDEIGSCNPSASERKTGRATSGSATSDVGFTVLTMMQMFIGQQ